MIIYARSVMVAKDADGNNQFVGIAGADQNHVMTYDEEQVGRLNSILTELTKLNLHMSVMSDARISDRDVEV